MAPSKFVVGGTPRTSRGLPSWWRREPVGGDRPTTLRRLDREYGLVGDRLGRRVGGRGASGVGGAVGRLREFAPDRGRIQGKDESGSLRLWRFLFSKWGKIENQ
ncbi:unnamed protein product [Linum trigynum]|uniref:Uncharacterized protein n=1 Tax=Linum trigynum TaxID=586398 RepID=A0AAV2CCL0_9ROSI